MMKNTEIEAHLFKETTTLKETVVLKETII